MEKRYDMEEIAADSAAEIGVPAASVVALICFTVQILTTLYIARSQRKTFVVPFSNQKHFTNLGSLRMTLLINGMAAIFGAIVFQIKA